MIPLKMFALAGNATFTISNPKTGNRFTFRVKQPKKEEIRKLRFVSVMTGCDNESSYTFLGTIYPNGAYFKSAKSRITSDASSARAFEFLWKNIDRAEQLPIEIRHAGKCCRCGRKLTVPESIDGGVGPECLKHFRNYFV